MAPSDFGLKIRAMVQKASGFLDAHKDTFYIYDEQNESWFQRRFQGRRLNKGEGKGRGDAVEKAAAEAVAEEDSSSLAERRRVTTRKTTVSLKTGPGKLNNPGGGKMVGPVGQTSQTQQIHGNHGIRNQCMSMQRI